MRATDSEISQVIQMYQEGLGGDTIGACFGKSKVWVYSVLRKSGTPVRSHTHANRRYNWELILQRLHEGHTCQCIADELGCAAWTPRRVAEENGIPTKRYGCTNHLN